MAERFVMPRGALVDKNGVPNSSGLAYLAGIQKLDDAITAAGADTAAAIAAAEAAAEAYTDAEIVAAEAYTDAAVLDAKPIVSFSYAVSDEVTNLTVGTNKLRFRMPFAFTLTDIRASLSVAQTAGSIFTVDVNMGTTILSTKLTIDNGEKTSVTAATPRVLSVTSLTNDAEMSIDIDQRGTAGARGLKVTFIGRRT